MTTTEQTPNEAAELDYSTVRKTWWAERDAAHMALFTQALPAVLESSFDMWQTRVDLGKQGIESPYVPTATITLAIARHLASGKTHKFLVIRSQTNRETFEKVRAYTDAHGLTQEAGWQLSLNLDATTIAIA